jgi:outer membrane receptor protein involved in Fe transport
MKNLGEAPANPYGIFQYQNIDKAEIKGIEMRSQAAISPSAPNTNSK